MIHHIEICTKNIEYAFSFPWSGTGWFKSALGKASPTRRFPTASPVGVASSGIAALTHKKKNRQSPHWWSHFFPLLSTINRWFVAVRKTLFAPLEPLRGSRFAGHRKRKKVVEDSCWPRCCRKKIVAAQAHDGQGSREKLPTLTTWRCCSLLSHFWNWIMFLFS